MKKVVITLLLLMGIQIGFDEEVGRPMFVAGQDYPLFKNGDCVQHKFSENIRYAISGKTGSYYYLIVWEKKGDKGIPRSAVMGMPTHASEVFIGNLFHKIDCNPHPLAFKFEIYEDTFDYFNFEERYSAKIF